MANLHEQTNEAQQEPMALETVYETIIQWDEGGGKRSRRELARRIVALYTRPQAREHYQALESALTRLQKRYADLEAKCQAREPLTDEQIHDIYDEVARREPYNMAVTRRNIARAIEAAHGIGEKK